MKLQQILISILMIGQILFIFSCTDDETMQQEVIRPVKYQQISLSGGELSKAFTGVSKAGTEAKMSFKVGGTISALNVKVGEYINKGKLIASIDDSDARLQLEKTQASLDKSLIQKETAKSNLGRVKGLFENNNASLSEYENAKSNYAVANSAYNADKRNVDIQTRTLSYYTLYAPLAGFVSDVNAEKSENVQAGQTIAIINAGNDIEVTVGIPESFISKIDSSNIVNITFSSIPDKVFDGEVSEVSYAISEQSSTYPVTVTINNPTQDIRPGMTAKVQFAIIIEDIADNLIVPVHSVGQDTEGKYLFVITTTDDNYSLVHKKPVTIGKLTNEGFEILNGLQDGDLVVTAGISNLTDGMKVKLLE